MAGIAFRALILLNLMLLIRLQRNGIRRTHLGTLCTADALIVDGVGNQGPAFQRRTSPLEMGLVFIAKVPEGGQYRIGSRSPQATQTSRLGGLPQLLQPFQIPLHSAPCAEPAEYFQHPLGAHPARRTFAAGLMLGEGHEIARQINHAIRVVQHHQSARSHDTAYGLQSFIRHRGLTQGGRQTAARGPADLNRLIPTRIRGASTDLLDNVPHGDSHGHFDQSAANDFPRQREHLGSLADRASQRCKALRPIPDDPRYQGKRFHIVNRSRFAPQSPFRRVGRPECRHGTFPLQRDQQGGFLAADKGARPFHDAQG